MVDQVFAITDQKPADNDTTTQPENPFAQGEAVVQKEPEWLGDLIRDGFYDKIVLIGFPFDEGARKAGNRRGADFGPDSFRRFVNNIGSVKNPEYGVNIASGIPNIADYGNIQISAEVLQENDANGQVIAQKVIKPSIEALYGKLSTKVGLCLQRSFIPVVIGGSRDLLQAVANAYIAHSAKLEGEGVQHEVTFLSVNNSLDVDPLLNETLAHQTSSKRYLAEKMRDCFNLWEFGLEGRRVPQQSLAYFESKLPENRRRTFWLANLKREGVMPAWNSLLDNLTEKAASGTKQMVHLSINLECIEGLKGVSTNCLSGGIPTEDAVEMMYQAGLRLGKADILTSVDIAEYNPYVEDQQTGRYAATLFYYLTLGLSQGIQERP